MYIGSVRFYKHLILTVVALLIIIPTTGFVYYAFQYQSLKTNTVKQTELIQYTLSQEGEPFRKKSLAFTVYASAQLQETINNVLPYQLKYPDLYVENDFKYISETEKTV